MTSTCVIQSWILGFDTVDRAVESNDFISYFWDDVSANKGMKIWRVRRFSVWEQVPVDHKLNGRFVHSGRDGRPRDGRHPSSEPKQVGFLVEERLQKSNKIKPGRDWNF